MFVVKRWGGPARRGNDFSSADNSSKIHNDRLKPTIESKVEQEAVVDLLNNGAKTKKKVKRLRSSLNAESTPALKRISVSPDEEKPEASSLEVPNTVIDPLTRDKVDSELPELNGDDSLKVEEPKLHKNEDKSDLKISKERNKKLLMARESELIFEEERSEARKMAVTENYSIEIKQMNSDSRVTPPLKTKSLPILTWMRDPVNLDSREQIPTKEIPKLDSRLVSAVEALGFTSLFPVQSAVWEQCSVEAAYSRDLCVCAPTGSGKTLAYVLPVVQGLASRAVRRLRALVVVPTRDLASQVKAVFDSIAPSVGLSVGLAIGQTSLTAEAGLLVDLTRSVSSDVSPAARSLVDILVATPGRLMDHLTQTDGFSLAHLRYLVVDETDRLLRQSYNEWLPRVLAVIHSIEQASAMADPGLFFWRDRGCPFPRVQKLLVSATLTRDPSKIHRLNLHRPLFISAALSAQRYRLPQLLEEFKIVCSSGEKPLYLLALLCQLAAGGQTIVFTASVQATHRLALLLMSVQEQLGMRVVEYSSWQEQRDRSASLEEFRAKRAGVLVASDAMTRGMDVEGVGNVVSYDVPVYPKTYVHRVGRTARAGKPGRAFTILRKEEVHHFKLLLSKAEHKPVKDFKIAREKVEELLPVYTEALDVLKVKVEEEELNSHSQQHRKRKNG